MSERLSLVDILRETRFRDEDKDIACVDFERVASKIKEEMEKNPKYKIRFLAVNDSDYSSVSTMFPSYWTNDFKDNNGPVMVLSDVFQLFFEELDYEDKHTYDVFLMLFSETLKFYMRGKLTTYFEKFFLNVLTYITMKTTCTRLKTCFFCTLLRGALNEKPPFGRNFCERNFQELKAKVLVWIFHLISSNHSYFITCESEFVSQIIDEMKELIEAGCMNQIYFCGSELGSCLDKGNSKKFLDSIMDLISSQKSEFVLSELYKIIFSLYKTSVKVFCYEELCKTTIKLLLEILNTKKLPYFASNSDLLGLGLRSAAYIFDKSESKGDYAEQLVQISKIIFGLSVEPENVSQFSVIYKETIYLNAVLYVYGKDLSEETLKFRVGRFKFIDEKLDLFCKVILSCNSDMSNKCVKDFLFKLLDEEPDLDPEKIVSLMKLLDKLSPDDMRNLLGLVNILNRYPSEEEEEEEEDEYEGEALNTELLKKHVFSYFRFVISKYKDSSSRAYEDVVFDYLEDNIRMLSQVHPSRVEMNTILGVYATLVKETGRKINLDKSLFSSNEELVFMKAVQDKDVKFIEKYLTGKSDHVKKSLVQNIVTIDPPLLLNSSIFEKCNQYMTSESLISLETCYDVFVKKVLSHDKAYIGVFLKKIDSIQDYLKKEKKSDQFIPCLVSILQKTPHSTLASVYKDKMNVFTRDNTLIDIIKYVASKEDSNFDANVYINVSILFNKYSSCKLNDISHLKDKYIYKVIDFANNDPVMMERFNSALFVLKMLQRGKLKYKNLGAFRDDLGSLTSLFTEENISYYYDTTGDTESVAVLLSLYADQGEVDSLFKPNIRFMIDLFRNIFSRDSVSKIHNFVQFLMDCNFKNIPELVRESYSGMDIEKAGNVYTSKLLKSLFEKYVVQADQVSFFAFKFLTDLISAIPNSVFSNDKFSIGKFFDSDNKDGIPVSVFIKNYAMLCINPVKSQQSTEVGQRCCQVLEKYYTRHPLDILESLFPIVSGGYEYLSDDDESGPREFTKRILKYISSDDDLISKSFESLIGIIANIYNEPPYRVIGLILADKELRMSILRFR